MGVDVLLRSVLLIPMMASVVYGDQAPQVNLQLFNVAVFGQPSDKPVALLLPRRKADVEPETVMVDVGNGAFYAATVRYPRSLSLEQARAALNQVYKKWERKTFANEPGMGIWRNEEEKFSMQLSQDDDNTVVIYIKYDRLPKRAEKAVEDALKKILIEATQEELENLKQSRPLE